LFILATVAAALIFAGTFYLIKNSSNDEVIAKINGQKVFRSEVDTKLYEVFNGQDQNLKSPEIEKLPKEVLEILVKEIYLEKELTKQAVKSDAAKTDQIKNKISDSKNKIIRQAYIDSILQKEITDEKVNNKYLELSKELEGKKEFLVSHIVVKTKEEAEKIAKELKYRKSKFAEFAKKYSIDQDTAIKGGNLDYILEDSMIKEIAAAVSSLKKDEISEPIQTKFGWHLVKISDIREAKPLSFEAVKDNIKDQLTQDKVNEINNKIINNLKIQILIKLKTTKEKPKSAAGEEAASETIPSNVPAATDATEQVAEGNKSDTIKPNKKSDAEDKTNQSKSKR
jgi:parvulin-like peptidyl-prolyl isomerase